MQLVKRFEYLLGERVRDLNLSCTDGGWCQGMLVFFLTLVFVDHVNSKIRKKTQKD